ncbi:MULTISPECIES: heavy metal translocating P-type ATPase [unclassified Brachybacterium]|uniref:heavy metal translocating P-type ATPase n=1 Tax=unclassified Brachybacterium TaxID=2623841 RepID=UPI00360DA768
MSSVPTPDGDARADLREHDSHGSHGGSGAHHGSGGHDEHKSQESRGSREHHGDHQDHGNHGGHGNEEGHGGHGGHEDHVAMFRRLFLISLVLSLPTVLLSRTFADLIGYTLPALPGLAAVPPVLGTIIFLWGGRPFLTGAVSELRSRTPGMMLLIGMAITVAFVASLGASLGLLSSELDFWWELAFLVVIMLLGHWLEMRSLAQTSSALDSLAALLPDEAEKLVGDDDVVRVAPSELQRGDHVRVRPGGRIPADGTVVDGEADVDESMITGESQPVHREADATVVAGTVATDSALTVRIDAVGDDTALAGIQKLVADAQSSSTRAQLLADRAAALLFWFALGAALLTAIVWTLAGSPDLALTRTITVLIIACPHALGLAIPLVVSIATERAARAGVLIKDRAALERMRTVDTVLFDKTGTLTRGEPALADLEAIDGDDGELLALAAAAESESEHPLARAIIAAARERELEVPRAEDFRASTGVGVTADIRGRAVAVGGPKLLEENRLEPMPQADQWSDRGDTVLHVVLDGQVAGALGLRDQVREESREAISALHDREVRVAMITGDARPVAEAVAGELGIDEVFAEVRPEHKSEKVEELQRQGRTVAMVGDGVNDAPALAQADVGIAIGAGTDVAISSAGVVLASDDPRAVLSVLRLSTAVYRKMTQNLWWAAGYNIIAVPLAAGVLAPIGFMLPMAVGALLMSASTIVVAANAQLLRRLDLDPQAVVAGETKS